MIVPEYHLDLEEQDIQVGSERVFVWDIPLVYGSQARGIISSGIKYITIDWDTKYLTFSMFKDTMFKDWGKFNYSSYLVTGFNTSGNMTSKKTSPYLSFFLTRTEDGFDHKEDGGLEATNPSSCWVQTMWDWSGTGSSGKWGAPFQAYRYLRPYIPSGISDTFNYGENVLVTKNKILGRGKSLAIKIYSEPFKDLQLLGWANSITEATIP